MWKRLVSVISVVVLFIPISLYGQSKVGTAGMLFLEIAPSARVAGMGGAFVGIADDVSALFYNPAGTARLPRNELLANGTKYPADIDVYYAGLIHPLANYGVLGASFTALDLGDMPVTDPFHPEGTGENFSCNEYAAQVSYSRMLTDRFATGITLRYIHSYLEEETASGIAADIGTFYDTKFKTVKMGMCISNFGPDMTYLTESFPLPMDFRVGISFEPVYGGDHHLVVDIEGHHPNHNVELALLGGEYSYKDMFFLRGGSKLSNLLREAEERDAETWSAGIGFKIRLGPRDIKLDAAYSDFGFLTNVQRVSLGMVF